MFVYIFIPDLATLPQTMISRSAFAAVLETDEAKRCRAQKVPHR